MSTPLEAIHPLLKTSDVGVELIADVTKYLSTLSHPIEVVEELISVCSITTSLLRHLYTAIARFPSTQALSQDLSFIQPLCADILSAFSQFDVKLSEARKLRVFEPNDVGLVRVPKNAWIFVMGGEREMGRLRSKLYVEKYRVRVLIDAVVWLGLRNLGKERRTAEEERELEGLSAMLPLVAERMVGVWKDYRPRIEGEELGKTDLPPQYTTLQRVGVAPARVQATVCNDSKHDANLESEKAKCLSSSTTSLNTTKSDISLNSP